MKYLIASAALAAAALCPVPASAADLRWQGTLFVTDITSACAPSGGGAAAMVGDQWTFVFRDADEGQAMSLIGQRRALAFVPDGGTFKKSGKYQGTFIGSNALPRARASSYAAFKLAPAKPKDGDRTITISGKILDFEGAEGCDATFEAAGIRRPGY